MKYTSLLGIPKIQQTIKRRQNKETEGKQSLDSQEKHNISKTMETNLVWFLGVALGLIWNAIYADEDLSILNTIQYWSIPEIQQTREKKKRDPRKRQFLDSQE